jgi:uncharacterized protein
MKTITEKLRSVFTRLLSIEGKPKKVALSYALGIFLATTPFLGVKAIIAIVLTQLFKWKKVAAVIGVYHVNALTAPFFYAFSFVVGKNVMGYDCSFDFPEKVGFQAILACFTGSKEVFLSLLIGGIIVGIPLAFAAYKILLFLLNKKRREVTYAH